MAKVGRNDLGRASIKALNWATALQGAALDSIRSQFFAESDELDVTKMTIGDFTKAIADSDEAARLAFEAKLGEHMLMLINQAEQQAAASQAQTGQQATAGKGQP